MGVKAEPRVAVKAERVPAASQNSLQSLPQLKAKVEQLRRLGIAKIKTELLRQDTSDMEGLVRRGLEMRAQEQNGKKQNAMRGRNRFGGPKLIKVKKERALKQNGRPRKKQRITAKRRRASREAMAKEVVLSQELGELLGAEALSRPETVRRLWAYCRDNGMLNPDNKREIRFDTKLEAMMGQKTSSMPGLISLLMPHFDY